MTAAQENALNGHKSLVAAKHLLNAAAQQAEDAKLTAAVEKLDDALTDVFTARADRGWM